MESSLQWNVKLVRDFGDLSDDERQAAFDSASEAVYGLDLQRADRLSAASLSELARRAEFGGRGVPTGLPTIDEYLGGGLPYSQVSFLIGQTGTCKSSIALDIARRHVAAGGVAIYVSIELPAHLLLTRMVCQDTAIPQLEILRGEHLSRCESVWAQLQGQQLYVLEQYCECDIDALISRASHGKTHPAILIVIDHLQLMALDSARDLRHGVEVACKTLMDLSKRTGAAVFCISTTSRGGNGMGKDGVVSNDSALNAGKESGAIEYAASVQLTLAPLRRADSEDDCGRYRQAWLVLAKNRLGPTGRAAIQIDGLAGLVREIPRDELHLRREQLTDAELELAILRVLDTEHDLTNVPQVAARVCTNKDRVRLVLKTLTGAGRILGGSGLPYRRAY